MTRVSSGAIMVLMLLAGCTAPASEEPEGHALGPGGVLTCERARYQETMGDIAEDAISYPTIEEAVDAFKSSTDWQSEVAWHALTPGDMSESPVLFTDERGWVYLAVTVSEWNDGYLVSGYANCVED